jgi:hypothetical protein
MALEELNSTYGPINQIGQKGTGILQGANTTPMANAQLGNPESGTGKFNSLEESAHHSLYGPFNTLGNKGTGTIPDQLGNIPPEIEF